MTGPQVTYLGDMQRLPRAPGDTFVLRAKVTISKDQATAIRAEWKALMGDEKLLIVANGFELGLVGSPELPSAAVSDVLAERRRQIEKLGWSPEHDDEHADEAIAAMAAFYLMPSGARDWDASSTSYGATLGEAIRPVGWDPRTGDRRRELVKGAALALAEIERHDRASMSTAAPVGQCAACHGTKQLYPGGPACGHCD